MRIHYNKGLRTFASQNSQSAWSHFTKLLRNHFTRCKNCESDLMRVKGELYVKCPFVHILASNLTFDCKFRRSPATKT